jgi:hypothetical protein
MMKHISNLVNVLMSLSLLELEADINELSSHFSLPWLLDEFVIRDVGHLDIVLLFTITSLLSIIEEEGGRQ